MPASPMRPQASAFRLLPPVGSSVRLVSLGVAFVSDSRCAGRSEGHLPRPVVLAILEASLAKSVKHPWPERSRLLSGSIYSYLGNRLFSSWRGCEQWLNKTT